MTIRQRLAVNVGGAARAYHAGRRLDLVVYRHRKSRVRSGRGGWFEKGLRCLQPPMPVLYLALGRQV